ncbi:MAG: pitrilysin family protein [Planctomycetota bacterium]
MSSKKVERLLYRKQKITLRNGLSLVWEHRPASQSVSITCVVGAGSRHDFPKKEGLAHFVEHMIFRWQREDAVSPLFRSILESGGGIDGETGIDTTIFRIYAHKDDAVDALRCLARLLSGIPDSAEAAVREKAILREELNLFGEDEKDHLQRVKFRLMGASEALQHSTGGTHRRIKQLTLEDAHAFHSRYYLANNMILCIVGNLNVEELREEMEAIFSSLCSGELEPNPPWQVASGPGIQFNTTAPHCALFFFFNCPNLRRESVAAVELLHDLYVGTQHARLCHRLREEEAVVYMVDTHMGISRDYGTMDIFTTTEPKNAARVVSGVLEEAQALCEKKLPPDEMDRLKNQLIKGRLLAFELPFFASEWYALRDFHLAPDIPSDLVTWRRDIEAVTVEDLTRTAREIFRPENTFAYIVGSVNIFRRYRIRKLLRRFSATQG